MACSAIGISPRKYLSPTSVPSLSGFTPKRSGFPNGSLSSRDFSLHRGRKGFFGDFGLYSSSKGFHLSSSCCRRPTYLRAYSRPGGFQKKLYYFRPESSSHAADLDGSAKPIRFRKLGKMGLSRRGLKRGLSARGNLSCGARAASDSQSSRKDQNLFGNTPSSKMTPFASSKKKLRCWSEDVDAAEPPQGDNAVLDALEQAIQYQVKEETRLFFGGPARGDLAEVEAFCRLYRVAEQLHSSVMDALRTHSTGANLDGNKDLGPYRGDVLEVEEKVASCLAHLMSILHEGKSEVLGLTQVGKATVIEEDVSSDDLPPFAKLRKEVRASCLLLEDALEALLPGDSQQGMAASVRIQKLKNACLDAGFPRPEGIPSPADIPNLAPVRLRPSNSARTLYNDEPVAFWRGGLTTEEGLEWLVEKGFKTIVDLREGSAKPLAQSAESKAMASGKLKVVRMPVESRSEPSKEQVEEFARLVADPDNKPLYLHTRAGVGRASAMVSRWREVLFRKQLQADSTLKMGGAAAEDTISSDLELLSVADAVRVSQEDALALANAIKRSENGHLSIPEKASSNGDALVSTGSDDINTSITDDQALAPAGQDGQANNIATEIVHHDIGPLDVTKNAFEAQRPTRNVLSKSAVLKFMKRKKAPSVSLPSSSSSRGLSVVNGSIAGPANRWTTNRGIQRGDISNGQPPPPTDVSSSSTINGRYDSTIVKTDGSARLELVNGRAGEGMERNVEQLNEEKSKRSLDSPPTKRGENGSFYKAPGDTSPTDDPEETDTVDGDMCASTTGVVRLQSRKKAEMFLVRTDGFSCTRERVKESTLAFSHPSTQQQMLMWKTPPKTVLLLKKLGNELIKQTQEVASFLHHGEGMNVMVEPDVHDVLARLPGFGFIQTFFGQDTSELHERVDFVVCLGGDGVILHASNLFRSAVPPVVSFNLGSLGFLTSHDFATHTEDLQAVIHGRNDMITGVYITLRMRLRCELYRNGRAVPGKVFDVLNEVVVDRGSNPYLCKVECYERNRLITKVQADGVIVATPTGSTAYSIAAGGSMVHPNVPCMLFTPICPHSLSFRPVILPDSALLELKVPGDARSNAWVSFDGKRRQQLSKGDSIRICMSEHPLPTVNKSDQTDDWFQSLVRCLSWNERLEQRPLSSG